MTFNWKKEVKGFPDNTGKPLLDRITEKYLKDTNLSYTTDDIVRLLKNIYDTLNKPTLNPAYIYRSQFVSLATANTEYKVQLYGQKFFIEYFRYDIVTGTLAEDIQLDRIVSSASLGGGSTNLIKLRFEGNAEGNYISNGEKFQLTENISHIYLTGSESSILTQISFYEGDLIPKLISDYPFISYDTTLPLVKAYFRPALVNHDGYLFTNTKIYYGNNSLIVNTNGSINIVDSVNNAVFVVKSYDWSGVVTAQSVWTPSSGKKFVLCDMVVTASAACTITIFDETDNTTLRIAKAYLTANGGFVMNYKKPYTSATINNSLKITTSATGGSITVSGYEI